MLLNSVDGSGNTSYTINRKFYVMGQFSQFIRPSCQLVSVGDANSLAAYTASNRTLVIVAVNDTTNGFSVNYDLSSFVSLPAQTARHRTSPTENLFATFAQLLFGEIPGVLVFVGGPLFCRGALRRGRLVVCLGQGDVVIRRRFTERG